MEKLTLEISMAQTGAHAACSDSVNVLVEHTETLCQLFLALAGLVLL